jgi:hypothetical protein
MDRRENHSASRNRPQRSLDYLRKRSQHRVWWNSARVASRRGQPGEPLNQPTGHSAIGKRV